MADSNKTKDIAEPDVLQTSNKTLIFISHDSRDAELAAAFSKLLKSVSSGMIKSFVASDKKGKDGIEFGEEWYKRLMSALQTTSNVICLFTERSLDRPWILFEAGVAKGKLNTPVIGVALGVSLNKINSGPFYQFQNMDDSESDLVKLIEQLASQVAGLELDGDIVKAQVKIFKEAEAEILKKIASGHGTTIKKESAEDSAVAKLTEEMKALPSRVAERLMDSEDGFARRKRLRRFHPMMFEEMMMHAGEPGDPVGILMAAGMVRDEAPWLYELAMEAYRAAKSGDAEAIEAEMARLEKFSEFYMHGPFMEELSFGSKESYMLMREFPRALHHMLRRATATKKIRRHPETKKSTN